MTLQDSRVVMGVLVVARFEASPTLVNTIDVANRNVYPYASSLMFASNFLLTGFIKSREKGLGR